MCIFLSSAMPICVLELFWKYIEIKSSNSLLHSFFIPAMERFPSRLIIDIFKGAISFVICPLYILFIFNISAVREHSSGNFTIELPFIYVNLLFFSVLHSKCILISSLKGDVIIYFSLPILWIKILFSFIIFVLHSLLINQGHIQAVSYTHLTLPTIA